MTFVQMTVGEMTWNRLTENKEKSLGSIPRTIDLPMVDVFCNQSWLNALFHR